MFAVRSLFRSWKKTTQVWQYMGIALCFVVSVQTVASAQEVWGVGLNTSGQIGDGSSQNRTTFVRTKDTTGTSLFPDAVSIAAGSTHTLALRENGTVYGWGRNQYGQLGNGNTIDRARPAQVRTNLPPAAAAYLTDVVAISAGYEFSLALKRDGTVWTWGRKDYYHFNYEFPAFSLIPVQVPGPNGEGFLSNVAAISAGSSHGMALLKNGTVWTWGYNAHGQLGDGTTTHRSAPVQVLGEFGDDVLTRIVAIAAGDIHCLALRDDGRVLAWGSNGQGAIGDGTYNNRTVPVPVTDNTPSGMLEDIAAIAAGYSLSLAVRRDGQVLSWGYNRGGALGTNSDWDNISYPVPVHGIGNAGFLTDCVSIAAGVYFGTALRSDGSVVSWGDNINGALGNGTTNTSGTPVETLLSSNNVHAVFSGGPAGHQMVLRSNGTIRVQVQLNNVMCLGTELRIELRPVGGGETIYKTVNAGPAGVISLTNLPEDAYNVAIKGSKWLQQVVPDVSTVGGANVLNLRFNLHGGDANDNNVVDILDLLIIIAAYNSAEGSPTFDERGDFNGDSRVDIIDLLTLIRSYNVKGDL